MVCHLESGFIVSNAIHINRHKKGRSEAAAFHKLKRNLVTFAPALFLRALLSAFFLG